MRTLPKFSTDRSMIVTCCIDLVGVHQKLGKGPLHAHKVTWWKTNVTLRNKNAHPVSHIINVSFRASPTRLDGYLGQVLLCWSNSSSLSLIKSLPIYASWSGDWLYEQTEQETHKGKFIWYYNVHHFIWHCNVHQSFEFSVCLTWLVMCTILFEIAMCTFNVHQLTFQCTSWHCNVHNLVWHCNVAHQCTPIIWHFSVHLEIAMCIILFDIVMYTNYLTFLLTTSYLTLQCALFHYFRKKKAKLIMLPNWWKLSICK